jgi:hypothetical protein
MSGDIHAAQRLEAVCRAYEYKIATLMEIIETFRAGMERLQAELGHGND